MPKRTQCRNFCAASLAKVASSAAWSLPNFVASSQPSRVLATFFAPQSAVSRAQRRVPIFFSRTASSPAAASSLRLPRLSRSCAFFAKVCAPARAEIACKRPSSALEKRSRPCSVSSAHTFSRSMPTCESRASCDRAWSTSLMTVSASTFP